MKVYTAGPCDTCGYTCGPSKTQPLAEHGLRMHSCTKNLAKAAAAQRGRQRDAAVDRTPKPCRHKHANHQHGTHACYVLDRCRCHPCSTANTTYEADRARRHAYGRFDTYADAEPVRAHVRDLVDAGIGLKRIAQVCGVAYSSLGKLIYGTATSAPSTKVTRLTAQRVLAVKVTVDTYAPGARIPNVGTKRRLQALMATGWSQTQLAHRIGMQVRNFNHLLHGKRAVTARTARNVADLYDELWDTPPTPSNHWQAGGVTRALRYAARHSFAPPMAWDDDLIDDPHATPDTGEPATTTHRGRPLADTVEDIEWYLAEIDGTATTDQVAHRLHMTRSGIQKALAPDRANRPDLLERLNRNAGLAGHGIRRTA